MVHTEVVNLIKESGRTITLTIGPPITHGKLFLRHTLFYFLIERFKKMIGMLKRKIYQVLFDHHHQYHQWLYLMEIIKL